MKTFKYLSFFLLVANFSFSQWQLTGNSNATSSSFIGTTATNPAAGQDINFRRAGVAAGNIGANKLNLGVNSFATSQSVSIGLNAGRYTLSLIHI